MDAVRRTEQFRRVVPFVGAVLQLLGWLLSRPDRAGSRWTAGTSLELWLGVEALLALLIGLLAANRALLLAAICAGWFLQMVHLAVLGEHYDGTLWGVGLVIQAVFAVLAAVVALLTRRLSVARRRT